MAKCFIIKFLGELDNDNLPFYDTFVIHVTPNVANAGNWSARAINFLSPKDIVIRTKDGGNHIAYIRRDYVSTEPTNFTNKVTIPANTMAGVYMKDDTKYDVFVSGLYSFTYVGSTNGGSSLRAFNFDINQLSNSTNLQTLNFYGARPITGDIANLRGLTNLQTLNLFGARQITGDIANLRGLTNLQTLNFDYAQITGDITELRTLVKLTDVGARPSVLRAITGDVKVLFDAMARTNRNNSCTINWSGTACTYSGDTSITPTEEKRLIKATFDGHGGYTVTNYGS